MDGGPGDETGTGMRQEHEQSEWLTRAQVAAIFGVSADTIRRRVEEGKIVELEIGPHCRRIHRSVVEAMSAQAMHRKQVAGVREVRRRMRGQMGTVDHFARVR